jgi:hypothetical protein
VIKNCVLLIQTYCMINIIKKRKNSNKITLYITGFPKENSLNKIIFNLKKWLKYHNNNNNLIMKIIIIIIYHIRINLIKSKIMKKLYNRTQNNFKIKIKKIIKKYQNHKVNKLLKDYIILN